MMVCVHSQGLPAKRCCCQSLANHGHRVFSNRYPTGYEVATLSEREHLGPPLFIQGHKRVRPGKSHFSVGWMKNFVLRFRLESSFPLLVVALSVLWIPGSTSDIVSQVLEGLSWGMTVGELPGCKWERLFVFLEWEQDPHMLLFETIIGHFPSRFSTLNHPGNWGWSRMPFDQISRWWINQKVNYIL